jgi:hypothetical protein
MSENNVIDIKTRPRRKDTPRVWQMAQQLIAMEDIREIVAVLADISADVPDVPLFLDTTNTPEINERVYKILREAVCQLEDFEDSLKNAT